MRHIVDPRRQLSGKGQPAGDISYRTNPQTVDIGTSIDCPIETCSGGRFDSQVVTMLNCRISPPP